MMSVKIMTGMFLVLILMRLVMMAQLSQAEILMSGTN